MKYIIQDREAGNIIDVFDSYDDAANTLSMYEAQDKADEIFIANFYEIVAADKSDIIYRL